MIPKLNLAKINLHKHFDSSERIEQPVKAINSLNRNQSLKSPPLARKSYMTKPLSAATLRKGRTSVFY